MTSHRALLAVALIVLAAAVACGTGGGVTLPNPQGNFSNASLNGSYVYEIHGFDTGGNPYRQIGVFTADGNGNITGGSDDSSFSAVGTSVTGSYTIGKDGTGLIGINTSLGPITWAVTLVSASKLQLIESDASLNAGGTAELQPPSAISATLGGTYVFRLHQETSAQSQAPAAEVGSLAISSGAATGSMDENLAGVFTSPNITATFGTLSGAGRGTGTLVNSSTHFTTNFVYYIVDVSKFVILVTNLNAVGSGRAELQSGMVGNGLSGNYVFGSRGDDSILAGVATVGQFNAASGTIAGTLDSSQDGTITSNANFSSCYTTSGSGRVAVHDLAGNTCSNSTAQVFWMVNPNRAFFVNASAFAVEDGTADLQQTQSFSSSTFSGQYSLAMDGLDVSNPQFPELLSRVGTLQFDGAGKLTLNEVVNASNSGAGAQLPTGGVLKGPYGTASNGRIVGTLTNSGGALNLVMYAVSGSQAYVLQTDPAFFTSGMVELQQ